MGYRWLCYVLRFDAHLHWTLVVCLWEKRQSLLSSVFLCSLLYSVIVCEQIFQFCEFSFAHSRFTLKLNFQYFSLSVAGCTPYLLSQRFICLSSQLLQRQSITVLYGIGDRARFRLSINVCV